MIFTYILFNTPHLFLKNKKYEHSAVSVFLTKKCFCFLSMHLKFSSKFYGLQLCDLFAYELPKTSANYGLNKYNSLQPSILVYNFHSVVLQNRCYLFVPNNKSNTKPHHGSPKQINSISELYLNSWWLERETSEMHGIVFENKKDLRNLLLQYGDTSTPFRKTYPSIGTKETVYDTTDDYIKQNPVSIQL